MAPEFKGMLPLATTETILLPAVDKDALLAEDTRMQGLIRFAAPVTADVSPERQGKWQTMPDGSRLWQCRLQSPGALGLSIIFDQFILPEGVKFYAYSENKKQILGAYTQASCIPSNRFLIGILKGEIAQLECLVPAKVAEMPSIHINRVDVSYDKNAMNGAEFDFGESLPCNVNVNCPAGTLWQTEKKGIARILMVFPAGEGWCSGSLIANTSGSYEPYVLTAHHCQLLANNPEFDLWRFDYDFEASGCNNPAIEPIPKSVLGCQRISYRAETDFMLLKTNPIPPNYDVYFNGWNRDNSTTTLPANTCMIHHPNGDIKKISIDSQAAVIYGLQLNWGPIFGTSPANSHWRTLPDLGIQQPGSSGAPLFDSSKRIRGQLHGGGVNAMDPCILTSVFYGRFNQSWDQGTTSASRLKEWLDPNNTNAITQNGYARPIPSGFDISGQINTHWGAPMPGIKVVLSNDNGSTTAVLTDTSGRYLFENITGGFDYGITPERDTNDLNGLTTFDLVLISKHILSITALDSPRKVLLGINPAFNNNTSWRFLPAFTTFPDPANPFGSPLPPGVINILNLQADYPNANFKGIKIGDTNNSAAPGQ
jgi:hypothetical protein